MSKWQLNLERALSRPDAPPVMSRDLLSRFARTANRNLLVPVSSLTHWQKSMVKKDKLQPIQRGLYFNRFRSNRVIMADVVPWLHQDAVVSLNTVLGDSGVLNNPVTVVTAIVPIDKNAPPPARLGRKTTRAGIVHFFAMPRRIVEAGKPRDRLEPTELFNHARATPEKALVDWLYLGLSPRSNRTPPPREDIDVELLDRRKLIRIAAAANLRQEMEQWLNR